MKVRELVSQLQLSYLPDDEVIVAYWDKETVEGTDLKLTDDQWGEVVEIYENGEWHWQGSAAEDFSEIASRVSDK
jgi:hypothetical protein